MTKLDFKSLVIGFLLCAPRRGWYHAPRSIRRGR